MDDREQGQKAAKAAIGDAPGQGLDQAAAQDDELFVGWCDATLGAGDWVKLAGLEPLEAAMLLCHLNPHKTKQDTAELASSDCTDDTDFKRLLSLFKDASRSDPSPRTLTDWLGIAKDKGAKHHPWVSRYLSITMPVPEAGSTATAQPAAGFKPLTVQQAIAPFVDSVMRSNPGWTAEQLYLHCRRTAGVNDSPFSQVTVGHELFCIEASKTCKLASIKAALTACRKRVGRRYRRP